MYTLNEMEIILQERLSKKRYIHSVNVALEAKKLAKKWNVDQEKAYLAGLLHDICKCILVSEQKRLALECTMDVTTEELNSQPLLHAIAGAVYVSDILKINDTEILNAIRYHSVARANMVRLEEVVFIADLISADRVYKDVERMRKLAYTNLKLAMSDSISFMICNEVGKKSTLPRHSIEAYNYYIVEK